MAWVDDDLTRETFWEPDIGEFLAAAGRLGVCPDPKVGLTPGDVAALQQFLLRPPTSPVSSPHTTTDETTGNR